MIEYRQPTIRIEQYIEESIKEYETCKHEIKNALKILHDSGDFNIEKYISSTPCKNIFFEELEDYVLEQHINLEILKKLYFIKMNLLDITKEIIIEFKDEVKLLLSWLNHCEKEACDQIASQMKENNLQIKIELRGDYFNLDILPMKKAYKAFEDLWRLISSYLLKKYNLKVTATGLTLFYDGKPVNITKFIAFMVNIKEEEEQERNIH